MAARSGEISDYIHLISCVRSQVVEEGIRIDGRRGADIRPIIARLAFFHGRMALLSSRRRNAGSCDGPLGTRRDEQRIDNLMGDHFVPFMLHYNFPPYCTGEANVAWNEPARDRSW